jgi:ubiquinone/menaquinone biosynthesis C-methylase UbiE
LKREGFDLDEIPSDWDLTIDDLARYCASGCPAENIDRVPEILHAARALAFDRKYSSYSYKEDVRGLGDFWQHDIRDVLNIMDASDYPRRRIVNVGIGNGLEGLGLFDKCQHLTIVDLAEKSLKLAQANLPVATSILSPAEDIRKLRANSQDIYVSLRTYQSAFFHLDQAIREAYRLVRQGGVVLISISNAFIGQDGAVVPGHIVPNSTIVDRNRPFLLAEKVRQKLNLFRFEGVGIRTGLSEIYIYGRRGR